MDRTRASIVYTLPTGQLHDMLMVYLKHGHAALESRLGRQPSMFMSRLGQPFSNATFCQFWHVLLDGNWLPSLDRFVPKFPPSKGRNMYVEHVTGLTGFAPNEWRGQATAMGNSSEAWIRHYAITLNSRLTQQAVDGHARLRSTSAAAATTGGNQSASTSSDNANIAPDLSDPLSPAVDIATARAPFGLHALDASKPPSTSTATPLHTNHHHAVPPPGLHSSTLAVAARARHSPSVTGMGPVLKRPFIQANTPPRCVRHASSSAGTAAAATPKDGWDVIVGVDQCADGVIAASTTAQPQPTSAEDGTVSMQPDCQPVDACSTWDTADAATLCSARS